MRIKVKRVKKPWTKFRKALVVDAVKWASEQIKLNTNVRLNVLLTSQDQDSFGDAYFNGIDTATIRLHDLSSETTDTVLTTLFHELWHIRQFLFEGLNLENGEFKGTTYDAAVFGKYWNCPWEVEARIKEKELLVKYNKHLDTRA